MNCRRFTIGSALSLLLFVAACVLWVPSYRALEEALVQHRSVPLVGTPATPHA